MNFPSLFQTRMTPMNADFPKPCRFKPECSPGANLNRQKTGVFSELFACSAFQMSFAK